MEVDGLLPPPKLRKVGNAFMYKYWRKVIISDDSANQSFPCQGNKLPLADLCKEAPDGTCFYRLSLVGNMPHFYYKNFPFMN